MEQQIVVLCGPDRCGKTEIARELSKRTGIKSYKSSLEHLTVHYEKQRNELGVLLSDSVFNCRTENRSETGHKTIPLDCSPKFVDQLRIADPRIADFIRQSGTSIIFDRSWPCEWVYSKLFDRETSIATIEFLETIYASLDARIIFCVRSSYEGIQDDIDDRVTSEKLQQIHDLYVEFSKWTQCKFHWLNVDDENLDREVTEIQKFLGL